MTIYRHKVDFRKLSSERLEQWAKIPPAIASDCMNRDQAMSGAISPIAEGTTLCGQAKTVNPMVADNSASHVALEDAYPGQVIVIAADGHLHNAVWGGLMARAAQAQGIAGIVIDGAVRDAAEIKEIGFPCFCIDAVPSGPHKGHGGTVDGSIACGGCPVNPGDLILGDDDGIVVVPLALEENLLEACQKKLAAEDKIVARIEAGERLSAIQGLPEAVDI
jgi:4-hydroxy-4-methyl-2-oxoglutarate aldolase